MADSTTLNRKEATRLSQVLMQFENVEYFEIVSGLDEAGQGVAGGVQVRFNQFGNPSDEADTVINLTDKEAW